MRWSGEIWTGEILSIPTTELSRTDGQLWTGCLCPGMRRPVERSFMVWLVAVISRNTGKLECLGKKPRPFAWGTMQSGGGFCAIWKNLKFF